MAVETPMVAMHGVNVRAGDFALHDIALTIARQEYCVLLGPTGAGKTMLIEALCGLRTPETGTITIADQEVTYRDPAQRNIGYVPQDYALLPFKRVRENMAFGLEARRLPRAEITARVNEMLGLLGIAHLATRAITNLSGGERQRVALGRALIIRPDVLLLDEPFSAIDEETREELIDEIQRLHRRMGFTTIHICHWLDEGLRLADRLVIIRAGRIVQTGSPAELLTRPRNLFVAQFLRLPNLFHGEVRSTDAGMVFTCGDLHIAAPALAPGAASALLPAARISLSVAPPPPDPARAVLQAYILPAVDRSWRPELHLGGAARLTIPGIFPETDWPAGRAVHVSFARTALHLFNDDTSTP